MSSYYEAMYDLELIGHVRGIPDASELSQELARRLKAAVAERDRLITERDQLAHEADKAKRDLAEHRLEIAQDKIDGFMDATAPGRTYESCN